MPDDKPPEKPTVSFPRPPDWAISLTEKVTQGLVTLNDKVDQLQTTVDTVQHDAKDTRLQIGRIWREIDEVKDRQANASMRAKEPSAHDLSAQSAIANEAIARSERDEQIAADLAATKALLVANNAMTAKVLDKVVEKATGFLKANPKLETALVSFVMAALTVGTMLLYNLAKGH